MIEAILRKIGVFVMNNTLFIVAVILAAKWLFKRKVESPVIAGMKHEPLESDLYLDTVAALRGLGVSKQAAKKRVTAAIVDNPNVSDPKELLKLCYQEREK